MYFQIVTISITAIMIFFSSPARAAEALMPITVTLIRCVTQVERINMCLDQNMCCELVVPGMALRDDSLSWMTREIARYTTYNNSAVVAVFE